jgi:ABC-type sugar transport system ATPase subunit
MTAAAFPLLSCRGVVKRYGAATALDGADLEVRAGEVHALLGENGAGKSTLLKTLSGAEQADGGATLFDGVPYAPARPRGRVPARAWRPSIRSSRSRST